MTISIIFHLFAALVYTTLGLVLWRPILVLNRRTPALAAAGNYSGKAKTEHPQTNSKLIRIGLLGALLCHGTGLAFAIIVPTGLHLGWALAFSAAIWLGLIVFWIESFILQIDSILLLLLPAAAISCLLAAVFPHGYLIPHAQSEWLRIHLLISMIAYGLITVAALHATLMTMLDSYLHRPFNSSGKTSWMAHAISAMPPLLTLEKLMFTIIWIGFMVLNLTIITGILVSLIISNQILPADHKTVFTLLSWFTFGILLIGRHKYGWRGQTALRWTLAGFGFLLLSYTGSRFVIEIILQRGIIG